MTARCFFKVIHDECIENRKLRLPVKFVSQHGFGLETTVGLQVRNDVPWEVKFKASKDNLYLTSGWKEFADHYALSLGFFLLFNYKGDCDFHVKIFALSTTEHDNIPLPPPTIDPNIRPEEAMKRVAVYRASTANPSFAVGIIKSHFTTRDGVSVPIKFARKYMKNMEKDVQVEKEEGDISWNVRCSFPNGEDDDRRRICWYHFSQHNELNIGGACVIELIDAMFPNSK